MIIKISYGWKSLVDKRLNHLNKDVITHSRLRQLMQFGIVVKQALADIMPYEFVAACEPENH